jgi:hypothetical protein
MAHTFELNDGDAALVFTHDGGGKFIHFDQDEGEELYKATHFAALCMVCLSTPYIMEEAQRIFDEHTK